MRAPLGRSAAYAIILCQHSDDCRRVAAIKHGGEGALYVHLRKKPGARGSDD